VLLKSIILQCEDAKSTGTINHYSGRSTGTINLINLRPP